MFWPITTQPASISTSGSNTSASFGAPATSTSAIPWIRVDAAGIGTPGSTRVSRRVSSRITGPRIATAPTWTMRSFATSNPVVSRSSAIAGRAASAV